MEYQNSTPRLIEDSISLPIKDQIPDQAEGNA